MSDWDEQIQKAVIEIVFESPHSPYPEEIAGFVDDVITRHFAGLASTYEKLVELVLVTRNYFGCDSLYRTVGEPDGRHAIRFSRDEYKEEFFRRLNDPQVQAAIGGKDGL